MFEFFCGFQLATEDKGIKTGFVNYCYGHEFLANIRTDTVWNKLKATGTTSLPILFNLAKDFALAYFQGRIL